MFVFLLHLYIRLAVVHAHKAALYVCVMKTLLKPFDFLPPQLKKLLLTPPNMPAGMDVHKEGVNGHRYCNRSLRLRPVRPLLKVRHFLSVRAV